MIVMMMMMMMMIMMMMMMIMMSLNYDVDDDLGMFTSEDFLKREHFEKSMPIQHLGYFFF